MNNQIYIDYRNKYRTFLIENVLPFWLKNGMDNKNGGLYTCLDQKGNLYNTDKSVWFQGRFGWILAKAVNSLGKNEEYKSACYSCLNFLNDYCIDKTDGRMYFSVTEDGQPLRKRRYFFSETFYTMAFAEASRAFDDSSLLEYAQKYYDFLIDIYKNPDNDPYKITPKVIPGTRRTRAYASSMILLNVTHTMREADPLNAEKYDQIAKTLVHDMFTYSYQKQFGVFLEEVGMNGEFLGKITGGRTINPGHNIEGLWFLINQSRIEGGNQDLLHKVESIFDAATDFGWDKDLGGLINFADALGEPPEQIEHDMKYWWPQTELMITSLYLFKETKNKKYWNWFEKSSDYAFDHFEDKKYGEWFGYLNHNGEPTMPAPKGNLFKGPFHLPRMLILISDCMDQLSKE